MSIAKIAMIVFFATAGLVILGIFTFPAVSVVAGVAALVAAIALAIGK